MNDFLQGMINTFKYTEEFETQKLMGGDCIQGSFDFTNTLFYKQGLRRLDVILDSNAKLLKSNLYADLSLLSNSSFEFEEEVFNGFEVSSLTIISNDTNMKNVSILLSRNLDFYHFDISMDNFFVFPNSLVLGKKDLFSLQNFEKPFSDDTITLAIIFDSDDDIEFLRYLSNDSKISKLYIYINFDDNDKQDYVKQLMKKVNILADVGLNNYKHSLFLDYDMIDNNILDKESRCLKKDIVLTMAEMCEDYQDVMVVSKRFNQK